MSLDIEKMAELERLAASATAGKWVRERDDLFFFVNGWTRHLLETAEGSDVSVVQHRRNLDFIAAANPTAVLELIERVERLERKNANQSDSLREYQDLVMGGDVSLGMLKADLRVTTGERDQLKAVNFDLHAGQQMMEAEIARLQRFETAYKEFSDKTDWVRPNAAAHELGMHVADILHKRCDDLTSHNQAQADEIVRLRSEAEDGLAVLRTQKQQVECYIKDAERYRLLRDEKFHPGSLSSDPDKAKYLDEYMVCGDRMDEVIDAQLAKVAP